MTTIQIQCIFISMVLYEYFKNSPKSEISLESWRTRESRIQSRNGVIPRGDQPVLSNHLRLSNPDPPMRSSSLNTIDSRTSKDKANRLNSGSREDNYMHNLVNTIYCTRLAFWHVGHSPFHYRYTCMSFSALLFCTNIMDALLTEGPEPLVGIPFIIWPRFLDVSLQLNKKILNGVEIRRVRRQIQQYDSRVRAQLLNSVRMMERCVIT